MRTGNTRLLVNYGPILLNGFKEGSKMYKFCLKVIIFFVQGNIQFWGIFQVKTLFQKLWPLLYKRIELDLRSTKFLNDLNVVFVCSLIQGLNIDNIFIQSVCVDESDQSPQSIHIKVLQSGKIQLKYRLNQVSGNRGLGSSLR